MKKYKSKSLIDRMHGVSLDYKYRHIGESKYVRLMEALLAEKTDNAWQQVTQLERELAEARELLEQNAKCMGSVLRYIKPLTKDLNQLQRELEKTEQYLK